MISMLPSQLHLQANIIVTFASDKIVLCFLFLLLTVSIYKCIVCFVVAIDISWM